MTVTGIITAIVVGAIIGALARLILPGRQNIPIWLTILVGIVAAVIGTFLARAIGISTATSGIDWLELGVQLVVAVIGVALLAGIYSRRGIRQVRHGRGHDEAAAAGLRQHAGGREHEHPSHHERPDHHEGLSSRSVPSEPVGEDQGEYVVSDRRVRVDGVNLQYLEAGSGPPLLLLHGHEQSATSWRWVLPVLARTHRVLALSLPGHGDSAPAVGGYAPGADLAPLVADFLDTLGVGPLHLVGNSVGGAVVLRLALADPSRVRTLTLVDSAGLGRGVNPLLALDTLPIIGELAITISRMPGGGVGRTSMSTAMLFAQPSRIPKEFFDEQHALGRRPGQLEASTAMARALFDANGQREVLLDQLPTLTMPTLVIWGGCDYVLPATQAQTAVDRLPHGRLALLADCGHLPHVECPDRFATVLSDWLAEHHDSS